MKVIVCPADRFGCGHYRILQPAAVLKLQEPTLEIEEMEGLPLKQDPTGKVQRVDVEADVLVFQRPLHHWMPSAVRALQRQGTRVVVELDDDFHSLHPRNGVFASVHPKVNPAMNWKHLMECCARADLVTVSTDALADRYGRHGRVRVLNNYVAEAWTKTPRASDGGAVGWSGVVGSHPDDLQVTYGGVASAVEETDSRFLCIGNGELVQKLLHLRDEPEVTGWVALDDYPAALARLDVGIVPLSDTRFNAAKSWLKGLEYAACGVPFVASDVAEYRLLHEDHGLGLLAKPRSRDWKRTVKSLLSDKGLADYYSHAGREEVRTNLTIERNAWRWAEAWEDASGR